LSSFFFLNLNQIPKAVILKVAIEVDQGTFTFWMHGPLGVKNFLQNEVQVFYS